MRNYRPRLKRRPRSRVDPSRPMREATHVAGRDLKRLGDAVKSAREQLGDSQPEFAERAGMGIATVQRVEKAEIEPRAATYGKLDRGAKWPQGTARAIVEQGIKPPPSVRDEPADVTEPRELSADERKQILAMSFDEVWAFAKRLEHTSELAAWLWLGEAARIKAGTPGRQPGARQMQ